jgi:hypothetical protein
VVFQSNLQATARVELDRALVYCDLALGRCTNVETEPPAFGGHPAACRVGALKKQAAKT